MSQTLLITLKHSYSILPKLYSYITDMNIVSVIDFGGFIKNKSIVTSNFDSVLIDNEVYSNEAVISEIISICMDINLKVYTYKPLKTIEKWTNRVISLTFSYDNAKTVVNEFPIPIIYISGEAPLSEILSSHIELCSCLSVNSLKIINFSNIPCANKIGFNTYEQYCGEFLEGTNWRYDYEKTHLSDENDLLIISDGQFSWNYQIQENVIPMNDICKNITPYDYVLFFIPLDEYTQTELTMIKDKITMLTGCNKVDFCVSHYFKDVLSGRNEQYMLSTHNDYASIKNSCLLETDYFLYDFESSSDILSYVNRISSK